ncbi:MAG: hypothetical protein IKB70_06990 [Bacilli bacterium]|nr:hypothetical protein [Bacilli bacterium]
MKNKILQALKEAGLYSFSYRETVANKAMGMVKGKKIDQEKFDSWLKSLNFNGQNIRAYFLHQLEIALSNKVFLLSSLSDVPTPQSVEEFEQSWEEWKELLSHFYSDDSDDCVPAKGVFNADDNTNKVRALSDGNGGLIYIDGSISKKYPLFEDLNDDEKRDLYDAVITVHPDASYLSRFEYVMEKIKPYETAS